MSQYIPIDDASSSPFYRAMDEKTLIYVEDKGQEATYEKILEQIFGENYFRTHTVIANQHGKAGVIMLALKEKGIDQNNVIYLLDKDFDNFFPDNTIFREYNIDMLETQIDSGVMDDQLKEELKAVTYNSVSAIKGVKYLKRYSIENYVLKSLKGIKHRIYVMTGEKKSDIDGNYLLEQTKSKLIISLKKIIAYKILNIEKGLDLSFEVKDVVDQTTFAIKEVILGHKLEDFKIMCCTSQGDCFETMLDRYEITLSEDDIPGKDILVMLIRYLNTVHNISIKEDNALRESVGLLTEEECNDLREFFEL